VFHNEFVELMSMHFEHVSKAARDQLVDRLIVIAQTDDHEAGYLRSYAVKKLSLVKDHLSTTQKEKVDSYPPEIDPYASPVFRDVSFVPPQIDELILLSSSEIVASINAIAYEDSFHNSYHSAGLVLISVIKHDPMLLNAEDLFALRPLSLISNALSSYPTIPENCLASHWALIRDVAERVLPNREDYHKQTREYLGSLIATGYRNGVVPQSLNSDFIEVARQLSAATEDEFNNGNENSGSWMNTVRGQGLHALIMMAFHFRRTNETAALQKCLNLLEARAPVSIEASAAVRGIFGMYLNTLYEIDKDWFDSQIEHFLPDAPIYSNLWMSVMSDHLQYGHAIPTLVHSYQCALGYLDELKPSWGNRRNVTFIPRFAVQLYLYDIIPLDHRFVCSIFERDDLASEALVCCTMDKEELDDDMRSKLMALWEWQLERVMRDPLMPKARLKEFGRWFASGAYCTLWGLRQLEIICDSVGMPNSDYQVIEVLSEASCTYPIPALSVLEKMLNCAGPYDPAQWFKGASQIMRNAANCSPELKERVEGVCGKLISRGFIQYEIIFAAQKE
jgi:hypothetical protein